MPNTIRESNSVNDFIVKNRIRVNGYLNNALLFFIITGPAIALGISTRLALSFRRASRPWRSFIKFF